MSKIKSYSLSEMEDKYIGEKGTKERDNYEYELRMDLLGQMIRTTRKEKKLTQEKLGELIGVNKSQISKLENNANSATIETIIRVFKALKAEISFNLVLDNNTIKIA
jgi:DNA-binding XRE family transcriptional regulator